MAEINRDLP